MSKRAHKWGELLMLSPVLTSRSVDKLLELPCPSWSPQTLDGLTFAELVVLQKCKGYEALALAVCQVLFDKTEAEVMRMRAADVAGVTNMAMRELERIAKLFQSCKVEPLPIEQRAVPPVGDWFSMVDWYARRMGYVDHNAASEVRWVYYYRCAYIDAEANKYERRLMKLREEELKSKQKKR